MVTDNEPVIIVCESWFRKITAGRRDV